MSIRKFWTSRRFRRRFRRGNDEDENSRTTSIRRARAGAGVARGRRARARGLRGGARNGRITRLAREGIERFWVAGAPLGDARRALVLLTYGAEGTRAWHVPFRTAPSWLAPAHGAEDPELELDRESYPCACAWARAACLQWRGARRGFFADASATRSSRRRFRTRFAPAPTSPPVLPARCATCSARRVTPRSRRAPPPGSRARARSSGCSSPRWTARRPRRAARGE